MAVVIRYGSGVRTLGLRDLVTVHPKKSGADEKKIIERCVSELDDLSDERTLYIVNDNQRPTKTKKIIERIDIRPEDKIIVASGSHRAPTERWITDTLGERKNVIIHDARRSPVTFYGRTSLGNDIYLNSEIDNAERIVVITSVEPHYFAGFTGGRKSFLPGIAKYETIERNHTHALDKNARVLTLENNPVHEEMMEACRFVQDRKEVFCVNMVLDLEGTVASIESGDIVGSFFRACDLAREIYAVRIGKKYDTVITVASPPMDISLYQAQKAMENAKIALKDGGKLVLISQCRKGIGAPAFYDLLTSGTPDEVAEKIEKEYRLGWHKAAKMAEALKTYEVCVVTDLSKDLLEAIHITPLRFSDLETLEGEILLMPEGGLTVPYL